MQPKKIITLSIGEISFMLSIFHFFLKLIKFNYKKKLNLILKKNLPKELNIFFDVRAIKEKQVLRCTKIFLLKKLFI